MVGLKLILFLLILQDIIEKKRKFRKPQGHNLKLTLDIRTSGYTEF